jgi:phosphohistidine swiveling domain-containing protein
MRYVIRPGDAADRRQLGGKAAALAALRSAGLPIPAWFAVAPAAFEASLSPDQRRAISSAGESGDLTAPSTVLADLHPSADVRDELAGTLVDLCSDGARLAVRSSAVEEDGAAHSFAGQLDSFLNVPPERVVERVADVWRSGFSPRTLAYRREHGLAGPPSAPAVLVQRMVAPEVSGVAFSADPVSGRRGVAVVSAVYGLGTALVSGEADADTYTIGRDGQILTRDIADKSLAHQPDTEHAGEGEGVRSITVAAEQARKPALDDEQAPAVAALARACERHFGSPQDIEWAIEDGRLYLLQSRPITSLATLPDPDGAYALWDNSNIAESYGGVTTPLTYSFARRAYEAVYRQLCRLMGVPETTIAAHDDAFRRMIGLIRGRIYYNLLSWYELLALAPGFASNRAFMEQMMGVREGLPESIAACVAATTWRGRLADRYRLARTIAGLVLGYRRLPHSIQAFYARVERALATPEAEIAAMRPDELAAAYRALERRLITHWDAPLVNDLFAMMFYGTLRRLVSSWRLDAAGTLQNDLLSGEGGIVSAEPARRVREMAALAAASPTLVAALCSGSLDMIQQELERVPAFAAAYDAYLTKFADRCLEELKLESPTLLDDPLPLLRSVGHLARQVVSESAQATGKMGEASLTPTTQSHARLPSPRRGGAGVGSKRQSGANSFAGPPDTTRRRQAERRALAALSGHPIRRLVFRWVLANARARIRDRENLRFERTRVFGRVRRILVELSRRFYALGALDDPRDIFSLELDEALGFVEGTATTADLKGLIAVRTAEFARYRAEEPPPDRFETRGVVSVAVERQRLAPAPIVTMTDGLAADDATRRAGLGCCPGIVRGPARVVRDPKRAELRPGEILVAERTDPGWILLFAAAAGVLVERGSLLSHSAIVARELGIPTIVSIPGLTMWLRDGDEVEFDGSSGVVRKITTVGQSHAEVGRDREASHVE